MKWRAQAPANIALIKYMGKSASGNVPANASLSYTLNNLISTVELELHAGNQDSWQALSDHDIANSQDLSLAEQQRFLAHLDFLKKKLSCEQYHFIVRSNNNFPSHCGLASSASSFAALTLTMVQAAETLVKMHGLTPAEMAALSRHGSGSSCRSFFSPWAIWHNEVVQPLDLPYDNLIHQVIIIAKEKKAVSSSQAHQRVKTSALYAERPARAQQRLEKLILNLQQKNWYAAYILVWQEFWDMMALFETSAQPFTYLLPDSLAVLNRLRYFWEEQKDGPLVTMDAGPNIHLLFRPDQHNISQQLYEELIKKYKIIIS